MEKLSRLFHLDSRHLRRYLTRLVFVLAVAIILFSQFHTDDEEKRLVRHKQKKVIDVTKWRDNPTVGCGGNFRAYGEEFVRLQFARLSRTTKVFSIPCSDENVPQYTFQYGHEGTPLQTWLAKLQTYPPILVPSLTLKKTTTIAIMRIEAHNLYHTMCEWYNVFLLSKLVDFNPSKVDILFLDDRPPGHMDEAWETLFGNVEKYSDADFDSAYTDLIWNVIGYESPLNFHSVQRIHFLGEFLDFFLSSYQLSQDKPLNCEKLTVTLFLRRDYMTHPERKNLTGGLVHRKFKNEDEILSEIKKVFDNAVINIVILEQISMKEQLKIITNTDVLIGMHGAGLTHILFLPRHAVVFEMFPKYMPFYHHFSSMARWRKLKHFSWKNQSPENEFPEYNTRIPAAVVRLHCYAMKTYICGT